MKFNKQHQLNSNTNISRYNTNQFHIESCCQAYNIAKLIFLGEFHR